MAKPTSGALIWMDLEMTGLEPEVDEIIEIATVVTSADLEVIEVGPDLILHQPVERFEQMDDWNKKQHTKSGLWEKVLNSKISLAQAEKETLDFISRHTQKGSSPLCGNSIWQDRRFIRRYMSQIDGFLHYRMIDVSTVKELTSRWFGSDFLFKSKNESHRAMDDILDSIEEMRFYKNHVFRMSDGQAPK